MQKEIWSSAYRKSCNGKTLPDDTQTPFTVIPNTRRYSFSSPFLFSRFGKRYIFAEMHDRYLFRTYIGYCELTDSGLGAWKRILRENHSLAYPCVFEMHGSVYLIPATPEANEISAYKATDFPDEWTKVKVLVPDNASVCNTVFSFCGKNYIFTFSNEPDKKFEIFSFGTLKDLLAPLQNKLNDHPVQGKPPYGVRYLRKLTHGRIEHRFHKKHLNFELFASSPFSVNSNETFDRLQPAGKPFRYGSLILRPAQNKNDGSSASLNFYAVRHINRCFYKEDFYCRIHPEQIKTDTLFTADGIGVYNTDGIYKVIGLKTYKKVHFPLLTRIYKTVVLTSVKIINSDPAEILKSKFLKFFEKIFGTYTDSDRS